MALTLAPRTYFVIDRVSKLAALVLIVVSLGGVGGSLSPILGILGVVVGIATIFLDVEDDEG